MVVQFKNAESFRNYMKLALYKTLAKFNVLLLHVRRILIIILKKKQRFTLKGQGRGHTNAWVRETCDIPTAQSTTCINRLKLFHTIINMQGKLQTADSSLLAALFGKCRCAGTSQLSDQGVPLSHANPWLKQFMEDIRTAQKAGILTELPTSVLDYAEHDGFQLSTFKQCHSFDTRSPEEKEPKAQTTKPKSSLFELWTALSA